MRVLVTGANGFLGKNLQVHLREQGEVETLTFVRGDSLAQLSAQVAEVDFIFHLAGVNRPQNESEFTEGNADLTCALCDAVRACGRAIPIVYTSSIQAESDNAYGASKRAAEEALLPLANEMKCPAYIYRLPNVFGKWCRPNYNSAVATFCHNIARDLPISINNPDAPLRLVYVDDVCAAFVRLISSPPTTAGGLMNVTPIYETTVGEVADTLRAFKDSRKTLITEPVGVGLVRALYATYVSYLPPERFSYAVPSHGDSRGIFVEMLKTRDSGQFSFFTAHPGITRGGHYHHSKTEKFMVIKGKARFGFRHIVTGEHFNLLTDDSELRVVETIPGWAHDITNIGDDEMIVLLWANEIFNRQLPDTISHEV